MLNKRKSWRVKEALRASLVSYGAWPGDQGRFYSREAEPRVPASRRDAAAGRKRGTCKRQEWSWGTGRRERERERVGEGSDGGKERLCSAKKREGRGPSYNAPLVHCPEEVRKREEGQRVCVHLLASTSSSCLFLIRVCPAASLRFPSFILVALSMGR